MPGLSAPVWVYDLIWEWNAALQKWLVAYANMHQCTGADCGWPPDCPWRFYTPWKQQGPPYLIWRNYSYSERTSNWILEDETSNWASGPQGACI